MRKEADGYGTFTGQLQGVLWPTTDINLQFWSPRFIDVHETALFFVVITPLIICSS